MIHGVSLIAGLAAGMLAGAAHPETQSAVTGRVVAVDLSVEPPLVETFGGRRFYEEPDSGPPQSRLLWIAFDCQGEEMARTHPWDPRWTTGAHAAPGPDGTLGPHQGAGLNGEPLMDPDAILPVQTARFVIIERTAEGGEAARHGPFAMPGTYCE